MKRYHFLPKFVFLLFIFTLIVLVRLLQPSTAFAAPNSSLPWASGVHAANEYQPHLNFGIWRGNPIDVVVLFTARDSWGSITNPIFIFNEFKNFNGLLVLSQPMYPRGQGDNSTCADGDYDNQWKTFGQNLVANNLNKPTTIIRIGWEFNGNVMYWHTDSDPTTFKNCWRHVAKAIKSTATNVRLDWTVNGHGGPVSASGNIYDAYPGDDVVDIVGTDSFDRSPPSPNQAKWDTQCNKGGGLGLCDIIKFAREHGKQFSLGEWGVAVESEDGGGDNAFYIQKTFDTLVENRDILAYESYYNTPLSLEPGNIGSGIGPNLGSVDGPQASAKYKELFGASSPAAGLPRGTQIPANGPLGANQITITPTIFISSPTPTPFPLGHIPEVNPWIFLIPGVIIFLAVMFQ